MKKLFCSLLLLAIFPVKAQEMLYFADLFSVSYFNKITLPNIKNHPSTSYLLKDLNTNSSTPWQCNEPGLHYYSSCLPDSYDPPNWYNDSYFVHEYEEIFSISDHALYILRYNVTTSQYRIEVMDTISKQNITNIDLPEVSFGDNFIHDKNFDKIYIIPEFTSDDILIVKEIDTISHKLEASYRIAQPNKVTIEEEHIAISSADKTLYLVDPSEKHLLVIDLAQGQISDFINLDTTQTIRGIDSQIISADRNFLLIEYHESIQKVDLSNKSFSDEISVINEYPYYHTLVDTKHNQFYVFELPSGQVRVFDSNTGQLKAKHMVPELTGFSGSFGNNFAISQDLLVVPFSSPFKNTEILIFDLSNNEIKAQIKLKKTDSSINHIFLGFNLEGTEAYFAESNEPRYLHIIDTQSFFLKNTINLGQADDEAKLLLQNGNLVLRSKYFVYFFPLAELSASSPTVSDIVPLDSSRIGRTLRHPTKSWIYLTQPYKFDPGNGDFTEFNKVSNQVNLFSLDKNIIIDTFEVGNYPLGISIDQSGSFGYVANYDDSTISIFDATKNVVSKTIVSGKQPVDIKIDEQNLIFYVTNQGDNSLSIFSSQTFEEINRVSLSDAPGNMVLNKDQTKAYITTQSGHNLIVVDLLKEKEISSIALVGVSASYNQNISSSKFKKSNRGIALISDGAKIITANPETYSIYIIGTQTDSIIDSFAYHEAFEKQIDQVQIKPQISLSNSFLVAEDINNNKMQWVLNLYDSQSILQITTNKTPFYDSQKRQLIFPEVMYENKKYQARLELISRDPVDKFVLSSTTLEANLGFLESPPHYANNYVYIPLISILSEGESINQCEVILKRIDNINDEQWIFEVYASQAIDANSENCDLLKAQTSFEQAAPIICIMVDDNQETEFPFCADNTKSR